MAFYQTGKVPTNILSSYELTGNTLSFDITDMDSTNQLTLADANATTGDSREILFSILDHFYQTYAALAAADKPTNVVINKSSSLQTNGTYRTSITANFINNVTGQEIVEEATTP